MATGMIDVQAAKKSMRIPASTSGSEVTLRTFGKDKYGRTLADVILPDGTNANHMLLK
jgi:endonuclease YncB( thermonuclease family)